MTVVRAFGLSLIVGLCWWLSACSKMHAISSNVSNSSYQSASGLCSSSSSALRSVALYFPGRGAFIFRDSLGSGANSETIITNAQTDWLPLSGDWTGSGYDSVGLYDPVNSIFNLKTTNVSGPTDVAIQYGAASSGWLPIAGDWTAKGYSSIGIYDPSTGFFYLKNSNTGGTADSAFAFGPRGSTLRPIVGDWVGDGISRVGLYDLLTSTFYLRMTNDPTNSQSRTIAYGSAGSIPVAGRWVSTQTTDSFGVWNGANFMLKNSLTSGSPDETFVFQIQGMQKGTLPLTLTGKWTPSTCRAPNQNTSPQNASWVKDMIVYEMRVETFSEGATNGGYFKAATALLPQLQDLGITAVSLNPIGMGQTAADIRYRVLYGPSQPDLIDPLIGSEADFIQFVATAHALGIKVIVDNVTHGIIPSSPYVVGPNPLPADYFNHNADGSIAVTYWGTSGFDWTSPALRNWWTTNIGVAWVQKYDVDGFRMDLEPYTAGALVWTEFRSNIFNATGKQIVLIPEIQSTTRALNYDMSQGDTSINNANPSLDFYNGTANVVDMVQSSSENFYSNQISCHDSATYTVQGRLSAFAYGNLLSPYIPRWFMGEEFNAQPDFLLPGNLYGSQLHWNYKTQNMVFYNQVKQLIRIRKKYQNIFSPGGKPLNQTNIINITQYSGVDLQPYAMWDGNEAIAVIASRASPSGIATYTLPVTTMGMGSYPFYQVSDLMSGSTGIYTASQMAQGLSQDIQQGGVIVLLVQGLSRPTTSPFQSKETGPL